jgi:hypothetical protein
LLSLTFIPVGEPEYYLATPANQPTVEDYAMVALLPKLDPSGSILILAGNSTFGTQAAVEYICREDSLNDLLHRLNVSKPADLKPFEAPFHVKIAHGVPVGEELLPAASQPLDIQLYLPGTLSSGFNSAAFSNSLFASPL